MKYFYILKKDDTIIEMQYSEEAYKKTVEEFLKGGNLILRPMGQAVPVALSASKISEILTEDVYLKQIKNTKAKNYIHDGVWRDTKEGKMISCENWKKSEMEETKRIEEKPVILSQKQKDRIEKIKAETRDMFSSWKKK